MYIHTGTCMFYAGRYEYGERRKTKKIQLKNNGSHISLSPLTKLQEGRKGGREEGRKGEKGGKRGREEGRKEREGGREEEN